MLLSTKIKAKNQIWSTSFQGYRCLKFGSPLGVTEFSKTKNAIYFDCGLMLEM